MTDTPQGAWMQEYERLRREMCAFVYEDGISDAYEASSEAVAARTALDAHVRGLVEENERLREAGAMLDFIEREQAAVMPVEGNIMPPGTWACETGPGEMGVDMGPSVRDAIRAAMQAAARAALAAPKDAP